jgi:hypothetical protein
MCIPISTTSDDRPTFVVPNDRAAPDTKRANSKGSAIFLLIIPTQVSARKRAQSAGVFSSRAIGSIAVGGEIRGD